MKTLVSAVLIVLATNTYAQVQTQKPVICYEANSLIESLQGEQFKEHVHWIGKENETKSRYALMVNPETSAWTLLQFIKNYACILGGGNQSDFVVDITKPQEKPDSSDKM